MPHDVAFRVDAVASGKCGPRPDIEMLGIALPPNLDMIALDEALKRLADTDPRQSELVELRFFGGLTIDEVSRVLGISPATVSREWTVARAWLYASITGSSP